MEQTQKRRWMRVRRPLWWWLGVCLLAGWFVREDGALWERDAGAQSTANPSFYRGMTVSCFGWGAAWATRSMYRTMKELRSLGTNWVSYHPYAWIRDNGGIRFPRGLQQPHVIEPLRFGRKLGIKMLLKPHIGYWGSRFSWRGAITFSTEAEWQRFFRDYQVWTVEQARIAQRYQADMFSVGVEYRLTLHREKEWRRLIAAVRKVYKGKLTYSANWDTYDKVPFWDALDLIGIQAYFPISSAKNPTDAQIRAGWKPILQKLEAFSKKHRKAIVFTELGYNYASHTLARPWDHDEGGESAGEIKLRAIRVALELLEGRPWLKGVFLWKWFPSRREIETNYTLQYPAMKALLRRLWRQGRPR
ncbi:MAG: hypothetical protein H6728_02255 [Myxococcales bacterium]|nr:hypothetical protein [Myxococcales bacterium]MCB9641876.1 hypothetical protein [Myxococcales bacterium]